jgi:peptidoglycan LD-endopeptidase CwlK
MDLSPTIKSVQRAVGVEPDGVAGPLTWAAISRALLGPETDETPQEDKADPRSEGFIATLNKAVQPLARQFILLLNAKGIDAKIISGYRTYEEQSVLYAKYKNGGAQAAPPGYSNHNFGLAFDIGIFEDGKYLEASELYREAGQVGKDIGLIWGGDWSNSDEPHFEFRPQWAATLSENEALSEYRKRNSEGVSIV